MRVCVGWFQLPLTVLTVPAVATFIIHAVSYTCPYMCFVDSTIVSNLNTITDLSFVMIEGRTGVGQVCERQGEEDRCGRS